MTAQHAWKAALEYLRGNTVLWRRIALPAHSTPAGLHLPGSWKVVAALDKGAQEWRRTDGV
jgi:hypothetical protein